MAKKKKQTIGYKYFASGHFVLCHGPIDSIVKISFQDKDAYLSEERTNRVISINKPSLFGGDEQSGGVQGNIELLFGHATQQKSSTLQRICTKISDAFGGLISAYRGVCSVVFDNVYIGTAPNMPDSKWRVKRIHIRHDGIQQWYLNKAEINSSKTGFTQDSTLYIALDTSGSMAGNKLLVLKQAMSIVFDELQALTNGGLSLNIKIQAWGSSATSITKMQASLNDYVELRAFVNDLTTAGGTDAQAAYSGAFGFFSPSIPRNNVCVCVSDGAMSNIAQALDQVGDMVDDKNSPFSISDGTAVKMRGVGIGTAGSLANFDNSGGSIPVVSGDNPEELAETILAAMITTMTTGDMNPAHIIRECLTNTVWGIGVSEVSIDDVSFKKAADRLYVEEMGMSIKWTDSTSINEFVDNIKEHINAQLYLDRVTNTWKLYLVRDDYDAADLISLDESNIRNLDFERRTLAECVNSVTVTYWDRERGKDSTVTVQDIARIAQQGGVISQSIDYKGFTNSDLASRVALRDLKTLSSTLASVSFDVDESFSENWHEGMPFKLSDASYGLSEAVMRIRTIKRGDGINNTVYVEAIEDSFSSPMQSVVEYVPPITSGDSTAKDSIAIAFEIPYVELVEQYGQDEVDAKLSNYPELGYVGMAAIRPNNQHINASLYVDAGAGYDERTTLDFCPSASLKNDIGYMDSSFELENVAEFELLEANHRIQINDEIMAFVSFNAVTNVINVKRGCFDTVPQKHEAGSKVFGWDNYSGIDDLEYLSGEVLSLKALTLTGSDVLELNEATTHSLTLSNRAIRPYPPANVKINSLYYPGEVSGKPVLTWVNRNRFQQTGGDILGWFEGGVTLEVSVSYQLIVTTIDASNVESAFLSVNVGTVNTYTIDLSTAPSSAKQFKIVLKSVRDSYESMQHFEHIFVRPLTAPTDLTATYNA